jgi:Domain of unknown function (DUF5664)
MRAGQKDDAGKDRYDLIPLEALRGVALVLTHGAQKYAPYGWTSVPNAFARYRAAAERHLQNVLLDGEEMDPESGLPHAWHYLTNCIFVACLMAVGHASVLRYRGEQQLVTLTLDDTEVP